MAVAGACSRPKYGIHRCPLSVASADGGTRTRTWNFWWQSGRRHLLGLSTIPSMVTYTVVTGEVASGRAAAPFLNSLTW